MLAAIGETFDPGSPIEPLITGVDISVRPQFYRLSIWTRTAPEEEDNGLREQIESIGKHFKTQVLGYSEGARLAGPLATEVEFQWHEDGEKKGKLRRKIIV
jgi:translation initiation factor 4E